MNQGTDILVEYLRRFKAVCDNLATIGKLVPDHKKSWWLLNGLGKGYTEIVTLLESHSERHQLDTTYTSNGLLWPMYKQKQEKQ